MKLSYPLMVAALFAAACSAQPGSIPPAATGPVTFTVSADPAAFSGDVTVSVWDADQLKIADETSGCSVSMDASGKETTTCPPGVTYRKPTPETTVVPAAQLGAGVSFASKTVTVGERYRLSVGGKAADNCNSAGGSAEGTAGGNQVALGKLDIAQTLMACVSPPPKQ